MTDEFKNGRKRSYPSDLPAGDSIENPIEIPDDLASKHDLNSTAKTSVPTLPDTALARSIYNEFMTPNNTFKSSVARTERLDRFNRYNRTSPQPTKPKSAPPVIKREETDVEDMNNNAVEDSLDGMVKEMRELLLDHRKTPPLVQPSTPPSRVSPSIYKKTIYPYPSFDELYKKTAIPKGPIKLNQEQQVMVKRALSGAGFDTLSIKTAMVQYRDICKLRPDTWLNDEIINFYMELISDRSQKNQSTYPAIHCFNTFFCTTLLESGYAKLKRWTKRVDIFSKDMVLIPVNSSLHWTLAVFDFRKKQLAMYDSLGGNNVRLVKALLQYLEDEHMDKKKTSYDASEWSIYVPKDIPHQKNGDDCGVFACTFAERISRDNELDFTQSDMIDLRQNMVYEIIQKQLLVA